MINFRTHLSLSLSFLSPTLSLSFCFSLPTSLSLSFSLPYSLSLFLFLSPHLSLSLIFSPHLSLSLIFSPLLSLSLSVSLSLSLSISLYIYLYESVVNKNLLDGSILEWVYNLKYSNYEVLYLKFLEEHTIIKRNYEKKWLINRVYGVR